MQNVFPARSRLIVAQCAIALVGLVVLALTPPATGRMLIVPLLGGNGGSAVRLAIDHGASLVAAGPFSGSVVIMGDRARLEPAAWSAGMMMVAAPPSGCGRSAPAAEAA